MHAITGFIFLVAMAVGAFAAPVAESSTATHINVPAAGEVELVTAATTHLYVCDSANFQGRCENLVTTTQTCYNLYNGWNDAITSLGPDKGTTCTIYENYDCQGRSIGGIVNPGIYNLNDGQWNFNDITSSYRCS